MEKEAIGLKRIFGWILLFLFFETVVAVLAAVLVPDTSVLLACAIMTALALAVWAVVMIVLRSTRHRDANEAPSAAPARRPSAPADLFTAELKLLLAEANDRLATAPHLELRGAKPVVTRLPLYLVVGPPRCGKTSILVNSGISPTLLAGEPFRNSEVVPTRSCNIWYASGAIFADVAGHVFADEPDQWEALLRVLGGNQWMPFWRRFFSSSNRTQTLRGVLLVTDSRNFLHASDDHQAAGDARLLAQRLQTVGAVFGSDFPVYTLLSNADAAPYFNEFFAHLSESEDQRALGATLPFAAKGRARELFGEAETKGLTAHFNRLCNTLGSKRLTMLARESSPIARGLIYEFPRELKRMRAVLVPFLVEVFRPNPLQRGPVLRGFYFCGIRRVAREPAAVYIPEESIVSYGADATVLFRSHPATASSSQIGAVGLKVENSTSAASRWSFLTEFFTKVLLADHAAPGARRIDLRLELGRNIALGVATASLLVLCLGWATSWSANRTLVNNAVVQLNNLSANEPTPANLETMESMRQELERLQPYEKHPPLHMRWGLYSGNRVIPALRSAYFTRFRRIFLDPMTGALSAEFAHLQPAATGVPWSDVYTRLKAYRMIASRGCRPDKPLLDETLPKVWPWGALATPDTTRLAERQIRFYTAELVRSDPYSGGIAENENAVKQARAWLAAFNGPDKLLRGLVDRANNEHEAVTLAQYAPAWREVLNGPDRVEWSYSREGRDQILKRIRGRDFQTAGESCVVGVAASAKAATSWIPGNASDQDALEALYLKEYTERWKQFLAGQEVRPFSGAPDAARKLAILSDGNRSPLLAALFLVANNTWTQDAEAAASSVQTSAQKGVAGKVAEGGLSRYFPGLQRKRDIAKQIAPAPATPQKATLADIARSFQPTWAAVDSRNPDRFTNQANAGYMASLAELGDALRPFGPKPDPTTDPAAWDQANRAEAKAWSTVRALETAFNRTPDGIDVEVKRLMEAPIEHVARVMPASPAAAATDGANTAAARLCRDLDQLTKKYPFNPSAREEVSVDALNRYFAPVTGELWRSTQEPPFATLLQRQAKAWVQNPAAAQPRLSPQFLSALTAQTQFSEALYGENGAQPRVEYAVSLNATAPIAFELSADGQAAQYTGTETGRPVNFVWPGGGTGESAKLTVRSGITLGTARSGLWGIFRLLGDAGDRRGNTFLFNKLDFYGNPQLLRDAAGNPFSLEVKIDSRSAIFDKNYFHPGCVAKAVQ